MALVGETSDAAAVDFDRLEGPQRQRIEATCAEMAARRAPWTGLERRWYLDDGIFALENRRIFRRGWLLACFTGEVRGPGDIVRCELAGESVLVVRTPSGELRAFINSCRHRGARLVTRAAEHSRRLVCPYHQWAYDLDGALLNARWIDEVDSESEKAALSLTPVALEEVGGLIFVCLADDPPGFAPLASAFRPVLEPHRLAEAKVAHQRRYVVPCNWKLVVENQRECYHCTGSHPEYLRAHFDLEALDPEAHPEMAARTAECVERWQRLGIDVSPVSVSSRYTGRFYRANRTPLRPGVVTESLDGQPVAPVIGVGPSADVDRDLGTGRVGTYLNFFLHVTSDHAAVVQYEPITPTRTLMTATWLVDWRAEEGRDYDLDRLVAFTSIQLEQDRELLELQGAGVSSHRYRPGRYSAKHETQVEDFVRWYLAAVGDSDGSGGVLQP